MFETRQPDSDTLLDAMFDQLRRQDVPPMPVDLPLSRPAVRSAAPPHVLKTFWTGNRVRLASVLVVAAAIAVGILLPFWGERNSTFAFADVQDAFSNAKTVAYEWLCFSDDRHVTVYRIQQAGRDYFRGETSDLYVDVYDFKEQLMMHVSHKDRSARILPLYMKRGFPQHNLATVAMRELAAGSAKKVGERTLDGRKVIDFLLPNRGREYLVTADASNMLPVRIESRPTAGSTGRELIQDFLFNFPIDQSQFAIRAPEGYHVERASRGVDEESYRNDSNLVVSPQTGIGSATFGMSIKQVASAFGKPELTVHEPSDQLTRLHYFSRGFDLGFRENKGLCIIRCWGSQHADRPFLGRTSEGIRMGATMDEVTRVYNIRSVSTESGSTLELPAGYVFGYFKDDAGQKAGLAQIEVEPAPKNGPGK
jgi:hypothetical protein